MTHYDDLLATERLDDQQRRAEAKRKLRASIDDAIANGRLAELLELIIEANGIERDVARLVSGSERKLSHEMKCKDCGGKTMHMGTICYSCSQGRNIGQVDYFENPTTCDRHGFHSWMRACPYCEIETEKE